MILEDMEQPTNVADGISQDKHIVMEVFTAQDLSPSVENKLSTMSCDNATCHSNYKEPDASATLCKLIQTLYLCLTSQL